MKMGLPGVPDILSWLVQQLKSGEQVGVNPEMFSVNAFAHMEETLGKQGVNVVQLDLIREIWLDRPAIPNHPIFVFDEKFSGKSSLKKMDELRKKMKNAQADVFITNTWDGNCLAVNHPWERRITIRLLRMLVSVSRKPHVRVSGKVNG